MKIWDCCKPKGLQQSHAVMIKLFVQPADNRLSGSFGQIHDL